MASIYQIRMQALMDLATENDLTPGVRLNGWEFVLDIETFEMLLTSWLKDPGQDGG